MYKKYLYIYTYIIYKKALTIKHISFSQHLTKNYVTFYLLNESMNAKYHEDSIFPKFIMTPDIKEGHIRPTFYKVSLSKPKP